MLKIFKNLLDRYFPSSGRNLFIPRKQAGMIVNHDTALTYSAIWRSVNLISQTISTLPWTVNRREFVANGDMRRNRVYTHPAANLLSLKANDEMSAQAWRETMLAWALTWGNAYSEIQRDKANRPVALWPIDPERVTPMRDDNDRLVYKVTNRNNNAVMIDKDDMFHLHGLGFDGLVGYSVIGYASRTIGLGLATEQFGSSFFENGATFSGVFEHPGALGEDAINHLRDSLTDMHGGPHNANKPLILEEGMKWQATSIPPDDAQFIETRKFTVLEVARWYGVPPHKLMEMEQSTFNNIEHQSIEFLTDALMPWIIRMETEANIKLISSVNNSTYYTKINVNSILRGDLKSRAEWYKTMMNLGVYSVNEVRALEDENPIGDEGDKRLVQLNQTTLEKIGEEQEMPEPTEPESEEQDDINERILEDTMDRITRREMHRVNDALKKYDGDRNGLINWMDKFFDEHQVYMFKQLELPLRAVSRETSIDEYIAQHIVNAKDRIISAFDGGLNG